MNLISGIDNGANGKKVRRQKGSSSRQIAVCSRQWLHRITNNLYFLWAVAIAVSRGSLQWAVCSGAVCVCQWLVKSLITNNLHLSLLNTIFFPEPSFRKNSLCSRCNGTEVFLLSFIRFPYFFGLKPLMVCFYALRLSSFFPFAFRAACLPAFYCFSAPSWKFFFWARCLFLRYTETGRRM